MTNLDTPTFSWDHLHCLLRNAGGLLYEKDRFLVNIDASERSIVFRYGIYLQRALDSDMLFQKNFQSYSLDCEFNRDGDNPKRSKNDNLIIPDLIIHERGSEGKNLLVVEFKKQGTTSKDLEADVEKLKELINRFHYSFAAMALITDDHIHFEQVKASAEATERGAEDGGKFS